MEPIIVYKPEMKVAGLAVRTKNDLEKNGDGHIPKLWRDYFEKQVNETIPKRLGNSLTFGLYSDYEDGANGLYQMMTGVEVSDLEGLPAHLKGETIPAAKYAVFTSNPGPLSEVVPELWQQIWKWFSSSSQERSFTYDFEQYDERSTNPAHAQVDIYIAIK